MTETAQLILVTSYMWKHELIDFLRKPLNIKTPFLIRKESPARYQKKCGEKSSWVWYAIAREPIKGERIEKAYQLTLPRKGIEIVPIEDLYL